MGIVTGDTVTLEQSSGIKKYQGYVIGCNNEHFNDGTWTPSSSVTGIGVSIDNSVLSVWNTNTGTSDESKTFTWTSSKLSGCTKTFTVVAKGIAVVKNYCPTATIELYDNSNNIISGGEGSGSNLHIKITVTDWKDIPESNKKTFGSYDDGGNNIITSLPSCYVLGYASWSNDSYSILGGLSGTNCADGEYSFSITICDTTYTKKYTKKTITYTCPTASFNTSSTKCNIYSTTTVYVNVSNWGSVTSGNYNSWGSKSGNNLNITVSNNKNYSYEINSWDSLNQCFSVIIRHEKADSCSDNSHDDGLKLDLVCVSSDITLSSVTVSPNYGNFVTTFNSKLSSINDSIELYIKNGNCTQTISAMHYSASLTQSIPIWRSALDIPCGSSSNCDNSCNSVSFTIGWTIMGTVNLRSITANGTTLSGSETNTFTLNPCTSSNFNISVNFA